MIEPERLDYRLTADSLVWDIGAYCGDFSAAILERFDCRVVAFEPMPAYIDALKQRLEPAARVFGYGLADRDFKQDIALAGDRTSAYAEAANEPGYSAGPVMPAHFRDIAKVLEIEGTPPIALAKINIEGGEYALLRRLLDADYIDLFDNLQIQFHTFMPSYGELYLSLKHDLERTHTLQWRWPWRWESWQRKA